MSFSTSSNTSTSSAFSAPACYPPRPRNRDSKPKPNSRSKPYTHSHLATPSPSASTSPSTSTPTSPSPPSPPLASVERWTCGLPGCTKTYGRVHELVRHLDSAHHSVLHDADDAVLLSAGIPQTSFAKLRRLLAKRAQLVCDVCGERFSRSDALRRHMDEQGHRPIVTTPATVSLVPPAVPTAPYGYQWQLVPVIIPTAPPEHIPTPQTMVPLPEPALVSPMESLLDEILAPSAVQLGDLQPLTSGPFEQGQEFSLLPLHELEALCAALSQPPPADEQVDAMLDQTFAL